jgi:hypothetical protein
MTRQNDVRRTALGFQEIHRIREAIESAVLGTASPDGEVERDSASFLRLVTCAKVAADESDRLLRQSVDQAKRAGHSWAAIGEILNISRQASQQRFGPGGHQPPSESGADRIVTGATGFNEMALLQAEGAAGCHLVSFGWGHLVVRPSERKWEHRRMAALSVGSARAELERQGWTYVGSWFPFHYFKRPIGEE